MDNALLTLDVWCQIRIKSPHNHECYCRTLVIFKFTSLSRYIFYMICFSFWTLNILIFFHKHNFTSKVIKYDFLIKVVRWIPTHFIKVLLPSHTIVINRYVSIQYTYISYWTIRFFYQKIYFPQRNPLIFTYVFSLMLYK